GSAYLGNAPFRSRPGRTGVEGAAGAGIGRTALADGRQQTRFGARRAGVEGEDQQGPEDQRDDNREVQQTLQGQTQGGVASVVLDDGAHAVAAVQPAQPQPRPDPDLPD